MKGCVCKKWILMNRRAKWIFTTPDNITTLDSPLWISLQGSEIGEARKKSNDKNEEINQRAKWF